jgi:hypothetical protein
MVAVAAVALNLGLQARVDLAADRRASLVQALLVLRGVMASEAARVVYKIKQEHQAKVATAL